MSRPTLIDICCGAGLATEGYRRAGWETVGVDLHPQPNYPGPFIQMDARALDVRFLRWFDGAHASPPCQGFTAMNNDKSRHLNLIPDVRALLNAAGLPYVIENVMGAARAGHLINPVVLDGRMFGLHMTTSTGLRYDLERKRAFETNWPVTVPPTRPGAAPIANIIGGHLRCRDMAHRTGKGTGRTVDFPGEDRPALARRLMGLAPDRAVTMHEMSEGIPPAYAEFLGRCMVMWMEGRGAAPERHSGAARLM